LNLLNADWLANHCSQRTEMSFTFEWPRFSDQFHTDAIEMLNNALNKGNKPPVIADRIEVVELEMGTQVSFAQFNFASHISYATLQPPELEIRDIGDLTMDHFRGIFRFTYAGDAHIVLKTKVQVFSAVAYLSFVLPS
jgi:distribution and morphology protein 34